MKQLSYYLHTYPFSILLVIIVLTLSFIKPPEVETPDDMDKWIHLAMYTFLSGIFWFEYLRSHTPTVDSVFRPVRAFLFATLIPALLGILTEYLQGLLTDYRTADVYDVVMNVAGVFLAGLLAWFGLRPYLHRPPDPD
ncbi:MAG: VanZ family protein [Tannerellaceae bacterium]|jgi:VanZ family protein|nr:VanZ family protein [Tannerellaceae bacterium]